MESVSISNAARNAVDASTRAKEVSVTSEVASTVSDETSSEPAYQISLSSESLVLSASSNVNAHALRHHNEREPPSMV